MAGSWRAAIFLQAGLLLLSWPCAAQVRLGEVSADSSGTISTGYTATYGNMTASDHSWTLGGTTSLSGSFYNPNFLSFNANLYLNQSRANSNYQSISNASGVDASVNLFGGSHFPGSITYSKAYNSEGNYDVPGAANFVTHGNNDALGINWSESLPNAPSFSAGFQTGNSNYSVYGTNDQGKNTFHSLNLHSAYEVAGFNMGAYYSVGAGHSVIPLVVAGGQSTETQSDNSAVGFNATHKLPLNGSFTAGVNRSSWDSEYLGYNSKGSIDTFNSLVSLHPVNRLSFSASLNYSDNLSGQLIQSIVSAGVVVPGLNSNQSSDSLDIMGIASYTPLPNLQTSAYVERRSQSFLGEDYGVSSYGGSATYSHKVPSGSLNAAMSMTANAADATGQDTLSFSTNENYSGLILGWNVTGSFGYAQNAQTLLVTYTNSFYNYSGNIRRRWGQFNVSAGAGGASTALTQQAGTTNSSEGYNASIGYGPWITGTGSYSKASGQALATGSGLVPVPVPTPPLPSSLISLFGGSSYSAGLSSSPVKRLILTATYAKSVSNISSDAITSANQNEQFNSFIQYQLRKLYFTSGFARLEQGFSVSGLPPESISTYYVGVSRWFNFF
ncbi:MAG: hypothetical protein WCA11_13620 [Terracidiphilus sp.]